MCMRSELRNCLMQHEAKKILHGYNTLLIDKHTLEEIARIEKEG